MPQACSPLSSAAKWYLAPEAAFPPEPDEGQTPESGCVGARTLVLGMEGDWYTMANPHRLMNNLDQKHGAVTVEHIMEDPQ